MNDFVAYEDGAIALGKGELDDVDGPVDTGTKSARAGEKDTHGAGY